MSAPNPAAGTSTDAAAGTTEQPPLEGTAQTAVDAADPSDIGGYQTLVQKLRDEIKAAKGDREPQADKDGRLIASLKKQIEDAKPKLSEYDKLVAASKTELERAQEAATQSAERASALVARAITAEIKALAADTFADPSDAHAFLELKKYANDAGDVDTEAITADLADLLARKPHLGKQTGPRLPAPNPALGSSAGGSAPDLDTQIAEATKTGNYALAISLKRQRAYAQQT